MIRETCGSIAGMLAHQAAGEKPCGWCAYSEQSRRIAAEGIAVRVMPPGWLAPVTAEQAEVHALVLDRETGAYDAAHRCEAARRGAST